MVNLKDEVMMMSNAVERIGEVVRKAANWWACCSCLPFSLDCDDRPLYLPVPLRFTGVYGQH